MSNASRNEPVRGTVRAVCLGGGGIPKRAVGEARVTELGLAGDAHRSVRHGGRDRAVCLFALEDYRRLQRDGVACEPPGAFGENVLTEGLDYSRLRPGDRLALGEELVLEIADVRQPCATLKSADPRMPDLMVGRSGFVCRVVRSGRLRTGCEVARVARRDSFPR